MRIFILISITALLLSCTKNSVSTPQSGEQGVLFVEVEHHFDDDFVQLAVDGKTLVSKKMTTNYTIHVNLPKKHKSKSLTFTMQDTLSIFIRYRPKENKIEFETADTRILRD